MYEVISEYMTVCSLRRADGFMAEEFADDHHRRSSQEQLRGEVVPKTVRTEEPEMGASSDELTLRVQSPARAD